MRSIFVCAVVSIVVVTTVSVSFLKSFNEMAKGIMGSYDPLSQMALSYHAIVRNSTTMESSTNITAANNITATTNPSEESSLLSTHVHVHPNVVDRWENSSCPVSIRSGMGIYEYPNETQRKNFANIVLITAVDYGFIDLYYNWLVYVKQHGLKHVVFALDEPTYEALNYSVPYFTSMLRGTAYVAGSARDRKRHLKLVCSKVQLKLQILQQCEGIAIVFSDVDIVMLQDPFQHDLGRLLLAGYDYVYSVESEWRNQSHKSHECFQSSDWPRKFREGNTGFDYTTSSSNWILDIMTRTLHRCSKPKNKLHDQRIFWDEMRSHQGMLGDSTNWTHCDNSTYDMSNISSQGKPSLCCLDPYHYPNGGTKPELPVVTFHANMVGGLSGKIEKLRAMNAWNL